MTALYDCGLPDLGSLKKRINFLFTSEQKTQMILSNVSKQPIIDDSGDFIRIIPTIKTFPGSEIKCIRFYQNSSCILRLNMSFNVFYLIKNVRSSIWPVLSDQELYEEQTNVKGKILFGKRISRIF
ncbi:hypothetical protein DRH27_01200 [Candidatus Falkowbacteria bacterium]|nr:MAG: hypothetical protein DRH27_01200 [Candidatus Falkowbacteria bacterium]